MASSVFILHDSSVFLYINSVVCGTVSHDPCSVKSSSSTLGYPPSLHNDTLWLPLDLTFGMLLICSRGVGKLSLPPVRILCTILYFLLSPFLFLEFFFYPKLTTGATPVLAAIWRCTSLPHYHYYGFLSISPSLPLTMRNSPKVLIRMPCWSARRQIGWYSVVISALILYGVRSTYCAVELSLGYIFRTIQCSIWSTTYRSLKMIIL